ncbi:MAG: flagellar transcriptional regulator FlhC [Methylotenera sp.]|nr:flagellar transcriptional regulator FlhC [Methylotenera sp.]MDO9232737.1 flagellar transcriptional regulator FlhC [Methylotenera sp.]MDO9389863.1 flagellar transcriptional regulator FlhC [Methylotenera sp.]MDP2102461.1 flagellar transcriptional regulator FlhC [Methylotenera sp.]MDP2281870.1 flagellar transcriptional regulator FlhC [Methylotenera sp.]
MNKKSVVNESEQIQLAMQMIKLGARLQLLEAQTTLSRERLIKLYKELKGVSPPKGMLPFSTDWFLTWQPNIHSSIFFNIYKFMVDYTDVTGIHAIIKAYSLYLQQVEQEDSDIEPVLSMTRAWTLVRFVESKMLKLQSCSCCGGNFIVNAYDLNSSYVCNLCHVPSRAGKTKKAKALSYKLVPMTA